MGFKGQEKTALRAAGTSGTRTDNTPLVLHQIPSSNFRPRKSKP